MRYRFQYGQDVHDISIERSGETYRALVDGQPYELELLDSQPGQLSLRFSGKPLTLYWANDGGSKWLSVDGCTYHLEKPTSRRSTPATEAGGETVRSPMPAQVRAVQVEAGDAVTKGQPLLLLEAMKMEIQIKAPAAGTVQQVLVSAGQAVDKDQLLVRMGE
jgi:acetyl/propionyl-CoA carboxylase alpha subunit